jgi:hypothetical protein
LEGNYHIGTSGLIYVLVSFIFFKVTNKIIPFDSAIIAGYVLMEEYLWAMFSRSGQYHFLGDIWLGVNTDAFFL